MGTYLWHDHSQLYRSDGLQGALIVLPREGANEAWDYDGDFTLFLSDWFHGGGQAPSRHTFDALNAEVLSTGRPTSLSLAQLPNIHTDHHLLLVSSDSATWLLAGQQCLYGKHGLWITRSKIAGLQVKEMHWGSLCSVPLT